MTKGIGVRAVVGLALLSLAAMPALAGEFYVGGALGQTSTDVPDMSGVSGVSVDDSSTGYKVFGGYNVARFFAVEAAYVDGASVSVDMTDPTPFSASFETSGFAFRAMGVLPIREKFSLFADYGMYMWDGDVSVSGVGSGSTDGTDPVYGVGFGWNVMPQGNLRVEMERYNTSDNDVDMDVDMYSVGFAYKF